MNTKQIASEIHQANIEKGFWKDRLGIPAKMRESGLFTEEEAVAVEKAFREQQLMLIVSELSEALEADRKDLMDDHLPQYKGFDVELVDAQIRLLDYQGSNNTDYDEIFQAKIEYNAARPFMHGKKY